MGQFFGDDFVRIEDENPLLLNLVDGKLPGWLDVTNLFEIEDFCVMTLCNFESFVGGVHVYNNDFANKMDCRLDCEVKVLLRLEGVDYKRNRELFQHLNVSTVEGIIGGALVGKLQKDFFKFCYGRDGG